MKCSLCKKEACFIIPFYNNKKVEYYEGRCEEHRMLSKIEERKHHKMIIKKKGK